MAHSLGGIIVKDVRLGVVPHFDDIRNLPVLTGDTSVWSCSSTNEIHRLPRNTTWGQ